jgi:hypothetical protein
MGVNEEIHRNGAWRQGQLPSGQTAKARPDYRVQSLHKGHGRRVPSNPNEIITVLTTRVCPVVDSFLEYLFVGNVSM